MPKNKGKGGKNRRRGKNENEGLKRELVFKEDGQEYAQVSFAVVLKGKMRVCLKGIMHEREHKESSTFLR